MIYNNFVWNINKPSCQISRIGSSQCCISKSFSRSVWRHKEFKNIKSFSKVGFNRHFDNTPLCICHKSTHSTKLTHLCNWPSGSRVCHHVNWVKFIQIVHHFLSYFWNCLIPYCDCSSVSFCINYFTRFILLFDFSYFIFSFFQNSFFAFWNFQIFNSNSNASKCPIMESKFFNFIQ